MLRNETPHSKITKTGIQSSMVVSLDETSLVAIFQIELNGPANGGATDG
jgi:hypothetical protein